MATSAYGSTASSESLSGPPRQAICTRPPRSRCRGPPIGQNVRVPLGETGSSIFPLMLGGAEFGWNVDLEIQPRDPRRVRRARRQRAAHRRQLRRRSQRAHHRPVAALARAARSTSCSACASAATPTTPASAPVNLVRAVEASLTRLRTDRIDVLYLDATSDHDPNSKTPSRPPSGSSSRARSARSALPASRRRSWSSRASSPRPATRASGARRAVQRAAPAEFDADLRLVAGAQAMAVTPSHALEHGFLAGRQRTQGAASPGVRGAQLAANINRRGSRTLRALDAGRHRTRRA